MYLSKQHGECLLRLKYGVRSEKGRSLLVSDNAGDGDGKTTSLQRRVADLARELGPKYARPLLIIQHSTQPKYCRRSRASSGSQSRRAARVKPLERLRQHLVGMNEAGEKCVATRDQGQMLENRPAYLKSSAPC